MPGHLYQVGDVVSLNFDDGQFFSKLDPFTVEAQMTRLDSRLRYRIKCRSEAFRRVVPEHQIADFGAQPSTLSVIILNAADPSDVASRKS